MRPSSSWRGLRGGASVKSNASIAVQDNTRPELVAIPGNGQTSLFLNQIPGIEALLTPFRGMLRLTSFTPVTVAGIRARYNERNDLLISTTPPGHENLPPPASGIYFPHFADAGGYSTQFILFSGQPGPASSGTLQFLSQTVGAMNLVIRQ